MNYLINFEKYGYKVILEGFLDSYGGFNIPKAYVLNKNGYEYWLEWNESAFRDMQSMYNVTIDEQIIIDLIVPYNYKRHDGYLDTLMLQTYGSKEKVREAKIDSILDS